MVVLLRKEQFMTNIVLFLIGFTSITSIYEIAKTGKQTKSSNVKKSIGGLKNNRLGK